MNSAEIQYVAIENGKPTAVIAPIELWATHLDGTSRNA